VRILVVLDVRWNFYSSILLYIFSCHFGFFEIFESMIFYKIRHVLRAILSYIVEKDLNLDFMRK